MKNLIKKNSIENSLEISQFKENITKVFENYFQKEYIINSSKSNYFSISQINSEIEIPFEIKITNSNIYLEIFDSHFKDLIFYYSRKISFKRNFDFIINKKVINRIKKHLEIICNSYIPKIIKRNNFAKLSPKLANIIPQLNNIIQNLFDREIKFIINENISGITLIYPNQKPINNCYIPNIADFKFFENNNKLEFIPAKSNLYSFYKNPIIPNEKIELINKEISNFLLK